LCRFSVWQRAQIVNEVPLQTGRFGSCFRENLTPDVAGHISSPLLVFIAFPSIAKNVYPENVSGKCALYFIAGSRRIPQNKLYCGDRSSLSSKVAESWLARFRRNLSAIHLL